MHPAMRRFFATAWALALPTMAQAQTVPAELVSYPNLVVLNGKVLTVDGQSSVAEAVAVRDGKIFAVGRNDEINRLVGPTTRVVDAGGRSVVRRRLVETGRRLAKR